MTGSSRSSGGIKYFVSFQWSAPCCIIVPFVAGEDGQLCGQVHSLGESGSGNNCACSTILSEQRLDEPPFKRNHISVVWQGGIVRIDQRIALTTQFSRNAL